MKILDDLISDLNFDTEVRDIRQGVFHTGVLTQRNGLNSNCGLASTLPRDAMLQDPPMVKEPGYLTDKTAQELASLAYSDSIMEAAIGMATINSLLDVDESKCIELNAANLIFEKGENKRVAIVGHFPFIPKARELAKELWVIEKNPSEGDLKEDEADKKIPQADVVAITGTSITNHTFEHLIELCDPKAYVLLLGDTAPLSTIFFDRGIDAVSGTLVADPDIALKCISQGANYRQIKGLKKLTIKKDN